MKYISLDIETTSLIPKEENILQIAMVYEDTEVSDPVECLPHLCLFIGRETYTGQSYALGLNGWIFDYVSGRKKDASIHPVVDAPEWEGVALEWLNNISTGRLNVAGKNVAGFDMQFMPESIKSKFRHRAIDVGSVFVDWSKETLKSLGEITGREVAHDALEDARDVIRALRTTYKVTPFK